MLPKITTSFETWEKLCGDTQPYSVIRVVPVTGRRTDMVYTCATSTGAEQLEWMTHELYIFLVVCEKNSIAWCKKDKSKLYVSTK